MRLLNGCGCALLALLSVSALSACTNPEAVLTDATPTTAVQDIAFKWWRSHRMTISSRVAGTNRTTNGHGRGLRQNALVPASR